jgi:hypothetical protein
MVTLRYVAPEIAIGCSKFKFRVGLADEKKPIQYVPEAAPVAAAAYSTITLHGPPEALAIIFLRYNVSPAAML